MTRRAFSREVPIALFLLTALLACTAACNRSQDQTAAVRELTICSYGGSFQEAQRKAFYEPFEKETGIRVREAQWSGEYAKLKAMVAAGSPAWDLVNGAESSTIIRGAREGILAPIDYTGIDRTKFYPGAVTDYSVAFDFYSTVLAYSAQTYPAGKAHPTTWADFWNTKRFPGGRSLRKDPRTTLEFALLADGVPMQKLYPLDVDRAFRSLDRIAPSVTVWWSSGHQPAQLLADKEVAFVSAFNGRIWTAATQDKMPVDVEWNQGALDTDSWVVPRGARHYKEAMDFIRYTCRADVQLRLTKYINYGPTLPEAYANLDAATRAILPTSPENRPKQFVFDAQWWADNESVVLERWNKWLVQR